MYSLTNALTTATAQIAVHGPFMPVVTHQHTEPRPPAFIEPTVNLK